MTFHPMSAAAEP